MSRWYVEARTGPGRPWVVVPGTARRTLLGAVAAARAHARQHPGVALAVGPVRVAGAVDGTVLIATGRRIFARPARGKGKA